MKLKNLEIAGFKSFHQKAKIDFPLGISAIVGPNGCGKSNVVDAMRWVMGEQSVKQLRGKSMEDVIFAGTNGNPPLNMAEVSLTLINDNGSAPEELRDYAEIMVTRRLYRSGDSAYFINKRPCRLKDVHNVFLGSGMGSKSYAVIQQGNIGAITDADPQERRVFIEEAAGVTRYKNRKKEALRKVDNTNQNLLRVRDIITEVSRQMDGLKRQARRAEQYKKLQSRVRQLDIWVSLNDHDHISSQIDEGVALIKGLTDTDIGHTSKLKQLDAAVEAIKLERWQKNQEIAAQKSSQFDVQRSIDRTENNLAHLHKDVSRLQNEATNLAAARKELKSKNEDILTEMAQVQRQHADLKTEIETIDNTLVAEHRTFQGKSDHLVTLNNSLESQKSQLMDLVAQEARCKNIYQNASSNRDTIQRRLKRIDEETVLAQRHVIEARQQENAVGAELEELVQALEDLEREMERVRSDLDERNAALGAQVKSVQTLELRHKELRSRFNTFKKMEDSYEWYRDGVKAIMKLRTSQSKGHKESQGIATSLDGSRQKSVDDPGAATGIDIVGMVADIIEPQPAFETAVEAVLGEALQYIIVNDEKSALAAIDFLQQTNAGRCGFISLTSADNGCAPAALTANTPLLAHVSVKPEHETIARRLLGNAILGEDITTARKLYNQNDGNLTVVTPKGDLISPQGALVGGSKDKSSGILTKKRQLKALQTQLGVVARELAEAFEGQKALETEVRAIENRLQQFTEQKNQDTQDQIELEKRLYKAGEQVKQAQRHHEIVMLEQEQLQGEQSDIDVEMAKHQRLLDDICQNVKTAQDRVVALTSDIGAATAELEAYNQRVMDLKLQLTAHRSQFENSTSTLRRLQEFQQDGLRQLEQLSSEIDHKTRKLSAASEGITTSKSKLAGLYEELKGLETVLQNNQDQYRSIDDRLKQNDTTIADIRTQREAILKKIRMLELEQSQRELNRSNIAQRLMERYHRSPESLRTEMADAQPDPQPEQVESAVQRLSDMQAKLARYGDVNLGAIKEFEQLKERYDFLTGQHDDLVKAVEDLHKVIRKINHITQERFTRTFGLINTKLAEVFPRLFTGGTARLVLTEPDRPLETGVEFMIHPPGKKLTRLSLLSGGEKALSAIAFIFSIFLIKPTSFCLMDEIDAPLDDANVHRFNELLKIIGERSQVVMITHNKRSMEFADTLFGVTMEKKGISKLVSVNLNRPPGPQ